MYRDLHGTRLLLVHLTCDYVLSASATPGKGMLEIIIHYYYVNRLLVIQYLEFRHPSKIGKNKKVLLRERKRYTTHHVASPEGGTYLGWGWVPILAGVPTLAKGGTYLGQGYLPWPRGIPTLAGGYLPWPGVPTLTRGTHLGQEIPTLAKGGTYLGSPGVDKLKT